MHPSKQYNHKTPANFGLPDYPLLNLSNEASQMMEGMTSFHDGLYLTNSEALVAMPVKDPVGSRDHNLPLAEDPLGMDCIRGSMVHSAPGPQPTQAGDLVEVQIVSSPPTMQTMHLSCSHPSTASGEPFVPGNAEDWESRKAVIEDLYITQNRNLKDVMEVMTFSWNFKATIRMYKRQFAKWNWYKYNSKTRALQRQKGKSCIRAQKPRHHAAMQSLSKAMPYENDYSRHMDTALVAFHRFIHGSAESDPTWKRTSKFESLWSYNDSFFDGVEAAIDCFDMKEPISGGYILRYAFLGAEQRLPTASLDFSCSICLDVPDLLMYKNREDILAIFLNYLSNIASIKLVGHPLARIIISMISLHQQPDGLKHYIKTLSKFLMDVLSELRGILDLSAGETLDSYLDYQDSSTADFQRVMEQYEQLRREAISEYGIHHDSSVQLEEEVLRFQWRHNLYQDDFAERCEALVSNLGKRNGSHEYGARSKTDIATYRRCYQKLMDFWEYQGDFLAAIECARRALDSSRDEQYMRNSISLEYLLRKCSKVGEAEEFKQHRLKSEWMKMVRRQVNR